MIWKRAVTLEEIQKRCRNSLSQHLGITFTEIGPDFMSATLAVDERTKQPLGSLSGGASAALAETVASVAANYCVEEGKICLGLELNINHIRAVESGIITAVTKPLHLGRSTQVWEIQILNGAKQLVAAARLTIAVISSG